MEEAAKRSLPIVTEMNEHFWRGGADGFLHFLRCGACGWWIHPYAARCPKCRSAEVAPERVSGRATVAGFTINHQVWDPAWPVPFAVAIVELEERSDLRLMTNLPRVPLDEIRIGLAVKVYFEPQSDGVFVPLFEKA